MSGGNLGRGASSGEILGACGVDVGAMSDCPVLASCRFFNDVIENMPAISESLKERYCLCDNSGCARFFIFSALGKQHLPDDVFPHEMAKARDHVRHFQRYGTID